MFKLIGRVFRTAGAFVKWATIIGVLAIVAVVIVAIVGLGKGVQSANKTAARVAPKFAHVRIGETETQLRTLLGKPDSSQTEVVSGAHTDYWYYGTISTKGGYQFVFSNGKLTAKNRY